MHFGIFDAEYGPSGRLESSFHVEADILSLLFLYELFIFFYVQYTLRFDKATLFQPLAKFNNLCVYDVLLFFEFIVIVSISIVLILLLYAFW